jgi:4-carboxymuconolactone decarboxylase
MLISPFRAFCVLFPALLAVGAAFAQGPRFPQLTPAQISSDQKETADRMLKETRTGLGGPWNVALRSPGMAARLLDAYNYYRWKSNLPPRLTEFGILIVAREWDVQYEWLIHYPLAVTAGMSRSVLADLKAGKRPSGMKADEEAVYDFSSQLIRSHFVDDRAFEMARKSLGEGGTVDLAGLVGTYVTFGAVLNVGQVGAPADAGDAYLPLKGNKQQ